MKKIIAYFLCLTTAVFLLTVCVSAAEQQIEYRFLTSEECADTLANLDDYYASINQRSLEFFLQKKGASIQEYIDFSKNQALEFTEEQKKIIEDSLESIENKMEEAGIHLPEYRSLSFAATTMKEACDASGYTHDTTIFLGPNVFTELAPIEIEEVIAHEVFHCLTRNNPEFRKTMYSLIHFTVTDADFDIPENVREMIITNPDVKHHDSYATFTINGEKKDCYLVFLTDVVFEKPGDSFFFGMYPGLVDMNDGTLYRSTDASDFMEITGGNTGYCEDPEECMATNFSYAIVYGKEGKNQEGYVSPELIENIIAALQYEE